MTGLDAAVRLVEMGLVPDWISRQGIRQLVRRRLREEDHGSLAANQRHLQRFIEELRKSPIAVFPEKANEQHYEVPPEFFQRVLGKHLKYSCCHWPDGIRTLDEAEESMLRLTSERAELEDGQRVLELGCGWGSFTLWMAENYPASRISAMSNSSLQRRFIESEAARRGLRNLEVVTSDINDYTTSNHFDRVVSVEMFEHVRNYERLLARIARWLRPEGKLFVHVFSHRHFAYPFETEGADNWMGRHFFTGGIMPSDDLLLHFQRDLSLEERWCVNGGHYAKTARAWLQRMDRNRDQIDSILASVYGPEKVTCWRVRWRLFFMACEELFGFHGGEEWLVSHYRFINSRHN
jgi:cyclopropane-fatty-acyl-phospholipid synthase